MTQTNQQNVPKLRFPGFDGRWDETTIGGLGNVVTGSTPDTSVSAYYGGDFPFYAPSDVPEGGGQILAPEKMLTEEGANKTRRLPSGATLFVCIGSTIGKVGITTKESATNQQINAIVPSKENDPQFVHFALVKAAPKIRELTAVQAVPIINKTTFQKEKIRRPTLPEQRKIAGFLGAMDTKIAQLAEKKRLLEDYKKGCMQQLFSRKIRFKDDIGNDFPDWEEKQLGEVFSEITEKVGDRDFPTYSISAGLGWVSQEEKFGRDISGQQNSKYTALQEADFSYNKGNSKSYRFGCVYPNDTGKVIAVPNVFISFRRTSDDTSVGFFAKLFENHFLDRGLRQLISSGARMDGLLNVNKADFFKLQIPYPHPDEQRKIANFLSALDRKIDLVGQELDHARSFKQGLLQQMFV